MNLAGRFIIDGYDLYEAFKVVVQEAQGLDVLPKVKKRTERDWPEESGVDVDTTTDLTYEAHDIILDCYVQESTYADAVKRINGVVKLLSSDGYHLLGSQLRQRLYPVLLQEVIGYKRITPASASAVYVQFTLKLRCPLPETRIGNATVEADEEVTLVIPTAKDFTVWWGDGTVNENTLTHTYAEAGTYTVLIAGTGVTSVVITGINIAEFSYPATGDITHVDVSHTSEEAYQRAVSIESGLKSVTNGGSVPDADYNWFKGVYASLVDGSVISWIKGIVNRLKDAVTRITALENNLIASITLTESVASLEIQLPTPEQDIEVEVDYTMDTDAALSSTLRVNDAGVNEYVSAASQTYSGFISYVARHSAKGTYRFTLINGYVFLATAIQQIWGDISTQTPGSRTLNGYIKTPQSGINKITFGHQINAGSVIKVRRVKRHA